MARDFSGAILTLAENGTLEALEEQWLTPNKECTNSSNSRETESLTLDRFWGVYVICAATYTICLLMALLRKYLHNHNHYQHEEEAQLQGNATDDDSSVWKTALSGNPKTLGKAATFCVRRRNSPRLESMSNSDELSNPQRTRSLAIEMS